MSSIFRCLGFPLRFLLIVILGILEAQAAQVYGAQMYFKSLTQSGKTCEWPHPPPFEATISHRTPLHSYATQPMQHGEKLAASIPPSRFEAAASQRRRIYSVTRPHSRKVLILCWFHGSCSTCMTVGGMDNKTWKQNLVPECMGRTVIFFPFHFSARSQPPKNVFPNCPSVKIGCK